jgi:spore coat polysaccharide biosynthesis protein SpsF
MRLVVVMQARMGSTRLPGKVLMPLAGKPLLERIIERVTAARTRFNLVVATTMDPADDAIVSLCSKAGYSCYRGDPQDLLDRHLQAARREQADAVAKIPSDCPLIDPEVIDRVLGVWNDGNPSYDYVSNLHPATYPDGNDVEVMSMQVLETAWKEATKDFEREHTTPFIWERPDRFRIGNVEWETGLDYSMTHRWTIDYPEDYKFISTVYDRLYDPTRPPFPMTEILKLLRENPEIHAINAHLAGVNWYRHHLNDLHTITASQVRPTTAGGE